MAQITCSCCGALVDDTQQICPNCGTMLDKTNPQPSYESGAPLEDNAYGAYVNPAFPPQPPQQFPNQVNGVNPGVGMYGVGGAMPPQEPNDNKDNNKTAIIIGVVVAVIAIIAIVIGVLFATGTIGGTSKSKHDRDDDDDNKTTVSQQAESTTLAQTTKPDSQTTDANMVTGQTNPSQQTTHSSGGNNGGYNGGYNGGSSTTVYMYASMYSGPSDPDWYDMYPSTFTLYDDGTCYLDGDYIDYSDDGSSLYFYNSDGSYLEYLYTYDSGDITLDFFKFVDQYGNTYYWDDFEEMFYADCETASYTIY